MADVTIIIPNFNGKNYIEGCLESLKTQTIADRLQIIVVDNASGDGSVDIAEKCCPEA